MAMVNTKTVATGFWIAAGFGLFALVISVLRGGLMKASAAV